MPYVKLFVQDLPKIEEINLVDDDGNPTGLAPNEVVEIDEWILDFSSLFREHLGIDAGTLGSPPRGARAFSLVFLAERAF